MILSGVDRATPTPKATKHHYQARHRQNLTARAKVLMEQMQTAVICQTQETAIVAAVMSRAVVKQFRGQQVVSVIPSQFLILMHK